MWGVGKATGAEIENGQCGTPGTCSFNTDIVSARGRGGLTSIVSVCLSDCQMWRINDGIGNSLRLWAVDSSTQKKAPKLILGCPLNDKWFTSLAGFCYLPYSWKVIKNSLSLGSIDRSVWNKELHLRLQQHHKQLPERFERLLDRPTILYTASDLSDGLDGTVWSSVERHKIRRV
jgi:hypothetical protein